MTRYAQRTLIQQPSIANWGKAAPAGIGVVNGYGVATGGTSITPWSVSGTAYNGMKFTADGTLTVTTAGLFDVLVQSGGIGGNGGGNGNSAANMGGGSTAGQMVRATIYLPATTHTVKIGAGQAGQGSHIKNPTTTAQLSSIGSSVYTLGGGMGEGYVAGGNGGGWLSSSMVALSGGTASGTAGTAASGGGAGVIGAGGNASAGNGGAGGTGFDATDYNGGVTYGVGGGGSGGSASGSAGSATSGGGTGGVNAAGGNGTANTGGGGGGCAMASPYTSRSGGNGGSGIVFVRFQV